MSIHHYWRWISIVQRGSFSADFKRGSRWTLDTLSAAFRAGVKLLLLEASSARPLDLGQNAAAFGGYPPDADINILGGIDHPGSTRFRHTPCRPLTYLGSLVSSSISPTMTEGLIGQPPFWAAAVSSSCTHNYLSSPAIASQCPLQSTGPLLLRHVLEPSRTPCPWVGCSESFVRDTDVQRHDIAVHLGIKYYCSATGCDK